jgi:hypothetical protein
MQRTTNPDKYSNAIKRLRKLRDDGMLSRKSFGYFVWFFWERRHGRA